MSDPERLTGRTPVNKVAARVVSVGVHYDPQVDFAAHAHWKTCPPLKPFTPVVSGQDLTGRRIGYLTVVGRWADAKPKYRRWVVRCDCGSFEVRSSRAIANAKNAHDRCQECRALAYQKRNEYVQRTGTWMNIEDVP